MARLPWPFRRKRSDAPPGMDQARWVTIQPGSAGQSWNDFQLAADPAAGVDALTSSSVYAVVSVIAQDVARLRVRHKRVTRKAGAVVLKSPIDAVLQRPNDYSVRTDFWLWMLLNLLLDGNAYAYTQRDRNGNPVAMHPRAPDTVQPSVDPQTGTVFYRIHIAQNDPLRNLTGERSIVVPKRDMLHVRLFADRHPLLGMSPLRAAVYPVVHGQAIQRQQTELFSKRAHPDSLLAFKTPQKSGYMEKLALEWRDRFGPGGKGGMAIVDGDATWSPTIMNASDAKLVEQYRLTIFDVARIYRVPAHMVGLTEDGGPKFNNVDSLQRQYWMQCLGFYLEHIEANLDAHFDVKTDERTEFEVERALMRTEFAGQVEALAKAVQGGIMAPNEAREIRDLPDVEGGDQIYLQRQMAPVENLGSPDPPNPVPDPTPEPPADPDPAPDPNASARSDRLELELERTRIDAARDRMDHAANMGSARTELADLRSRLEATP